MRYIILIALFLCSCATDWKNEKYLKADDGSIAYITAEELHFHFTRFGVEPVILVDSDYAIIQRKWLDEFLAFHADYRFQNDFKWETFWDCDDFARDFANLATKHHGGLSGMQAMAIGEVFYQMDSGVYHAINIALTDEGILFIEPQASRVVELSEAEKLSIFYIRF